MNIITVVLSGISIVTTLTTVILGSLLSSCNNESSYDTVMGGKTEVEKDEYGLVILDEGECNCTTGLKTMSWTILEVIVIGVLIVVAIMMSIKGVVMTIGLFKEKKQEKLIEKQKQEELTREQIRMEERNIIATIEKCNACLLMDFVSMIYLFVDVTKMI